MQKLLVSWISRQHTILVLNLVQDMLVESPSALPLPINLAHIVFVSASLVVTRRQGVFGIPIRMITGAYSQTRTLGIMASSAATAQGNGGQADMVAQVERVRGDNILPCLYTARKTDLSCVAFGQSTFHGSCVGFSKLLLLLLLLFHCKHRTFCFPQGTLACCCYCRGRKTIPVN